MPTLYLISSTYLKNCKDLEKKKNHNYETFDSSKIVSKIIWADALALSLATLPWLHTVQAASWNKATALISNKYTKLPNQSLAINPSAQGKKLPSNPSLTLLDTVVCSSP
jgi:hypothetical protein